MSRTKFSFLIKKIRPLFRNGHDVVMIMRNIEKVKIETLNLFARYIKKTPNLKLRIISRVEMCSTVLNLIVGADLLSLTVIFIVDRDSFFTKKIMQKGKNDTYKINLEEFATKELTVGVKKSEYGSVKMLSQNIKVVVKPHSETKTIYLIGEKAKIHKDVKLTSNMFRISEYIFSNPPDIMLRKEKLSEVENDKYAIQNLAITPQTKITKRNIIENPRHLYFIGDFKGYKHWNAVKKFRENGNVDVVTFVDTTISTVAVVSKMMGTECLFVIQSVGVWVNEEGFQRDVEKYKNILKDKAITFSLLVNKKHAVFFEKVMDEERSKEINKQINK